MRAHIFGLKKLVLLILLFAFTFLTFNKGFTILDFYANRSEIAMKYCINKNRPSMHCNGHCFLMRELKKEQDREKSMNDEFKKLEFFIANNNFPDFPIVPSIEPLMDTNKLKIPKTEYLYAVLFYGRLLKPPIA